MRKDPTLSETVYKNLLEDYLRQRGVFAERIPEKKKQKMPDYSLMKLPYVYLAEMKAPELHINPSTGMYMYMTQIRKIREFVHKAYMQFNNIDPEYTYPRVVVFLSCHFQLNGHSLANAIFGNVNGQDYSKDPKVMKYAPYLMQVDMVLWLQVNPDGSHIYQATFASNQNSSQKIKTDYLRKILSATPASEMDQSFEY